MTRALLLYNPVSGTDLAGRSAVVERVAGVLRGCGYDVCVEATTHAGSAGEQARLAVEDGAEVVFVCGGDGTIHDALQGLVGARARLAPIPLGSGNALCRELGVPLDAVRAAESYRTAAARDVAVGVGEASTGTRYFLLMAGAGADGALMHRMRLTTRARMGRWAYAWYALQLLFSGGFPPFRVRYCDVDGVWREGMFVSAMALRIRDLGGVFPGVGRGASLWSGSLRLVLVRGPARLGLTLWFVSAWLRMERWNPLLVRCEAVSFACDGDAFAQVDGEFVGALPFSASMTERTVSLLVPVER